jgi:hypothetical protein
MGTQCEPRRKRGADFGDPDAAVGIEKLMNLSAGERIVSAGERHERFWIANLAAKEYKR